MKNCHFDQLELSKHARTVLLSFFYSIFRFELSLFCQTSSNYRKVASSNTSCLEGHAGFFKLLMKGIFDPYVLSSFDKKLIS